MSRNLPPFIIVGLQPWDTPIGSNCKNIAHELAQLTTVLYINIPLDWNTLLRPTEENKVHRKFRQDVRKGLKPALEMVEDNLYVYTPKSVIFSINMFPDGKLYDFFNLLNNKAIAKEVLQVKRELGIDDFILFNDNDMFRSFYMKELLKPTLSIYYSRDNLISTDYFKKHGKRIEPKIIEKSDLTVANSTYLRDYCKKYNPNSYYIGQGCDLSIFNPDLNFSKPEDMRDIPHPIIGYIGFLTSMRLDISLLENLALERPDWSIVLVGPEDPIFKQSKLHSLKNVFFLGSKKPEELGTYLNFFDVAINPQLINEMTIGNYPRKVDEYLAMGKAVVATSTKAMSVFAQHCYLAQEASEYPMLIDKALKEDTPARQKQRIEFAHTHTWGNSVNELLEAVDKHWS